MAALQPLSFPLSLIYLLVNTDPRIRRDDLGRPLNRQFRVQFNSAGGTRAGYWNQRRPRRKWKARQQWQRDRGER